MAPHITVQLTCRRWPLWVAAPFLILLTIVGLGALAQRAIPLVARACVKVVAK